MDARFFGQLRVRKKPEYAQPVIEADNDDPFLREILAVIARLGARSGLKSAAVKPHHYRESEEHTSELQSLRHLVCRLLLEKKKDRQASTTPVTSAPASR